LRPLTVAPPALLHSAALRSVRAPAARQRARLSRPARAAARCRHRGGEAV